jgi:hypothetical protein
VAAFADILRQSSPRTAGSPSNTDVLLLCEAIAHHWRMGCP